MKSSVLLALALTSVAAKGPHVLRMSMRPRPIKDEQTDRVAELHNRLKTMSKAADVPTSAFDTTYSTPDIEPEAYYAYPLTLDYVVDVAFQNGTDSSTVVSYPVIVDTGSSNLAVAVRECTNCDTGATTLDLGQYTDEDGETRCIDVTYGSGSWDGVMSDEIQVGFTSGETTLVDEVYVGAITSSDGFFAGGYNGILGLAYSALAESYTSCSTSSSQRSSQPTQQQPQSQHHQAQQQPQSQHHQTQQHRPGDFASTFDAAVEGGKASTSSIDAEPLLDTFYDDGLMTQDVFSILFCGSNAAMAIGGVDESQIADGETLTFVDTQKTYGSVYGYFLVEVDSVSVGTTTVSTDSKDLNEIGGVLVDSGTTLIYLPSSVTSAIEAQLEKVVPSISRSFFSWSSCISESELSSYPDLTLALDGYDLVLSPSQYMLWYDDCYYWGISSSSVPIIGNVALQDKLVVFDKATNTVGFAEGDCSAYGGDSYSSASTAAKKMMRAAAPIKLEEATPLPAAPSASSTNFLVGGSLMGVLVALIVVAERRRRSAVYHAVPDEEFSI